MPKFMGSPIVHSAVSESDRLVSMDLISMDLISYSMSFGVTCNFHPRNEPYTSFNTLSSVTLTFSSLGA